MSCFANNSLTAPDPLRKEGLVNCVQKLSVRNFDWMTFTGYVSVMPTSIQPNPLQVIKAWWYYSIKPNPTEMIGFSVLFLVINLLEAISMSCEASVTSSNLKWSDLIGAAQILAASNFFYTVSPYPLFLEGRLPWDYTNKYVKLYYSLSR